MLLILGLIGVCLSVCNYRCALATLQLQVWDGLTKRERASCHVCLEMETIMALPI